jgi:hypothetical protein
MSFKSFSFIMVCLFSSFLVGCGSGEGDVPEGTPPTPESGSEEYEQYNSGSKDGPGS